MNFVLTKYYYSEVKEKVEKFLITNNCKGFIVIIKISDFNKIKNSLENFFNLKKAYFEDKNIIAMESKLLKVDTKTYLELVKKDPNFIKIRNKIVDYNYIIIN
jgi:DNA-binding transcriptional regulator/RsmH inhibitor MraZ